MQILITGGTGLIGRHLIPRLRQLGHAITVVTRSPEKARQVLGSDTHAGHNFWQLIFFLIDAQTWAADTLNAFYNSFTLQPKVPEVTHETQKRFATR
jgi:nucleoside-diphosphate-sugar epimerase